MYARIISDRRSDVGCLSCFSGRKSPIKKGKNIFNKKSHFSKKKYKTRTHLIENHYPNNMVTVD